MSRHTQLWGLSKFLCTLIVSRPHSIPFLSLTGGSRTVEYNSHEVQLREGLSKCGSKKQPITLMVSFKEIC